MIDADLLTFARTHYPGFEFILHFGSTADGTAHPLSDIDLLIVFEKPVRPFRETRRWNDALFDAWIYDLETLNGVIHQARGGPSQVMLDIVISARVLPDMTERASLLKTAARRIRDAGPLMQDRRELRHLLTGLIDALRRRCERSAADVGAENERLAFALDLHNVMQQTLLTLTGAGGFRRAQAIARLRTFDAAFFDAQTQAMRDACGGRFEPLLAAADELLARLGGPLREGLRSPLADSLRIPLPVI